MIKRTIFILVYTFSATELNTVKLFRSSSNSKEYVEELKSKNLDPQYRDFVYHSGSPAFFISDVIGHVMACGKSVGGVDFFALDMLIKDFSKFGFLNDENRDNLNEIDNPEHEQQPD